MDGLGHSRTSRVLLVAAFTLASAGLMTSPAVAAEEMTCSAMDVAHFSPGISIAGGESRLTIRPGESSMHCDGTINGHRITGPVTYSATGTAVGDCTSGGGVIESWEFSFPTAAGIQLISSSGEYSYIGPQGTYESSAYDGNFAFFPLEGSCLDGVTASLVVLHGTFPTTG